MVIGFPTLDKRSSGFLEWPGNIVMDGGPWRMLWLALGLFIFHSAKNLRELTTLPALAGIA